jgi:prepilin-type N-terminal cleavage/methylation domain-containing protein
MKHKLSGFTLSEVIIVVAVLAIVLTIATPDMNLLFAKQAEMNEELRMKKLYKALDLFAKENKRLPNNGTWVEDLQPFTDLTLNEVRNDIWSKPRSYNKFEVSVGYMGGTYKVNYATIFSNGIDGITNGVVLPSSKSTFANFEYKKDALGKKLDNFAVKYTDQGNKVKLVESTLSRIEKLSIALAKYARVKQINGISSDPENSDKKIYFPNDNSSGPGTYGSGVETIDNRNDARSLAKLLGLPEYYGLNAVSDKPMWYISNPGPSSSSICSGRRSTAPYYPPVIMVDDSSNPC